MKKLVLSCLAGFMSVAGMAQLSFDTDTGIVQLSPGTLVSGYIEVTNNSNFPIDIQWNQLLNTLNNDWTLQFCDCAICFENEFGPLPTTSSCSNVGAGSQIQWYVSADPGTFPPRVDTFTVEVVNQTLDQRDTLTWITQMPNNVYEIAPDLYLSVYPNPAAAEITLEYTVQGAAREGLTFRVFNLLGEEVHAHRLPNTADRYVWNASAWNSGLYLYQIQDGDQVLSTGKLTIAH